MSEVDTQKLEGINEYEFSKKFNKTGIILDYFNENVTVCWDEGTLDEYIKFIEDGISEDNWTANENIAEIQKEGRLEELKKELERLKADCSPFENPKVDKDTFLNIINDIGADKIQEGSALERAFYDVSTIGRIADSKDTITVIEGSSTFIEIEKFIQQYQKDHPNSPESAVLRDNNVVKVKDSVAEKMLTRDDGTFDNALGRLSRYLMGNSNGDDIPKDLELYSYSVSGDTSVMGYTGYTGTQSVVGYTGVQYPKETIQFLVDNGFDLNSLTTISGNSQEVSDLKNVVNNEQKGSAFGWIENEKIRGIVETIAGVFDSFVQYISEKGPEAILGILSNHGIMPNTDMNLMGNRMSFIAEQSQGFSGFNQYVRDQQEINIRKHAPQDINGILPEEQEKIDMHQPPYNENILDLGSFSHATLEYAGFQKGQSARDFYLECFHNYSDQQMSISDTLSSLNSFHIYDTMAEEEREKTNVHSLMQIIKEDENDNSKAYDVFVSENQNKLIEKYGGLETFTNTINSLTKEYSGQSLQDMLSQYSKKDLEKIVSNGDIANLMTKKVDDLTFDDVIKIEEAFDKAQVQSIFITSEKGNDAKTAEVPAEKTTDGSKTQTEKDVSKTNESEKTQESDKRNDDSRSENAKSNNNKKQSEQPKKGNQTETQEVQQNVDIKVPSSFKKKYKDVTVDEMISHKFNKKSAAIIKKNIGDKELLGTKIGNLSDEQLKALDAVYESSDLSSKAESLFAPTSSELRNTKNNLKNLFAEGTFDDKTLDKIAKGLNNSNIYIGKDMDIADNLKAISDVLKQQGIDMDLTQLVQSIQPQQKKTLSSNVKAVSQNTTHASAEISGAGKSGTLAVGKVVEAAAEVGKQAVSKNKDEELTQ